MTPPRFPEDDLLRQHGFRIQRRRKGRPVLWRRGDLIMTQQQALEMAKQIQKEKKRGLLY